MSRARTRIVAPFALGVSLLSLPASAGPPEPGLWSWCARVLARASRFFRPKPAEPVAPLRPLPNPLLDGVVVPAWTSNDEIPAILWGVQRLTDLRKANQPVRAEDLLRYVEGLSKTGVTSLRPPMKEMKWGRVDENDIREYSKNPESLRGVMEEVGQASMYSRPSKTASIAILALPEVGEQWTPEMRAARRILENHLLNVATEEICHHVQNAGGKLGSKLYEKYLAEFPKKDDHETEVGAYLLEHLGRDRTGFNWHYYPEREHFAAWVRANADTLRQEGLLLGPAP